MSDMNLPGSWRLDVQGDLSHIMGQDGEHIATTYGKDARLIVECHNRVLAHMSTGAAAPQDEPIGYLCRHSAQEKWFISDTPGYWEHKPVYERAALPAQAAATVADEPVAILKIHKNGHMAVYCEGTYRLRPADHSIQAEMGYTLVGVFTRPAPVQDVAPSDARGQIRAAFPLLDDEGLDPEKHHCEWAIQQERKRLHALLAAQPAAQQSGIPGEFAAQPADAQTRKQILEWAVERWNAEVSQRPLKNVHRRSIDDTWRQVIRHCGGDPVALLGPDHSELLARTREGAAS